MSIIKLNRSLTIDNDVVKDEAKIIIDGKVHNAYFECDSKWSEFVNRSDEHWLIVAFVFSLDLRKPSIHIDSADKRLVYSLQHLNLYMRREHNLPLDELTIVCNHLSDEKLVSKSKACFFSGGIDSTFSIINQDNHSEKPIDSLISVWGFDIPLSKKNEYDTHLSNLSNLANLLSKKLISVTTNLRDFEPFYSKWGIIAHGGSLSAVGHFLSQAHSEVIIASSFDYSQLFPWGSHPLTDQAFSSNKFWIKHDDAAFNRMQKTEYLSTYPDVMKKLHVCYNNWDSKNCSTCKKCVRTMLALMLVRVDSNVREAFDWELLDLENGKVYLSTEFDFDFFKELLYFESIDDFPLIKNFILRSMSFSRKRIKSVLLMEYLMDKPIAWRFAGKIKKRLTHIRK